MLGKCLTCGKEIKFRGVREAIHRKNPHCSNQCRFNGDFLFWKKVRKTTECWLWEGATTKAGYGLITRNNINVFAHRFSWEKSNGEIPKKLDVCHRCDTPNCVNPDHLFLGTRSENIIDAVRKGRVKTGVTAEIAKSIYTDYANNAGGTRTLAKKYKLSRTTIRSVLIGKTWIHVKP